MEDDSAPPASQEPQQQPPPAVTTASERELLLLRHNHRNNMATNNREQQEAAVQQEDYVGGLFMSSSGHLSFENPNYSAIDPARLDDHLNSNIEPAIPVSLYEELRQLEAVSLTAAAASSTGGGEAGKTAASSSSTSSNRKTYAAMDISAMGVGDAPETTLDNKIAEEKMKDSVKKLDRIIQDSTKELMTDIESHKLLEATREKEDKSDGEAEAAKEEVKLRRRPKKKRQLQPHDPGQLPAGWEKHEDDEGPYYWHVKSGTIQRETPRLSDDEAAAAAAEAEAADVVRNVRSSRIFDDDDDGGAVLGHVMAMSKSCTSGNISDIARGKGATAGATPAAAATTAKRRSMPPPSKSSDSSGSDEQRNIQVTVRSLGWVELRDDELTPENSSKAVNRCIVQLTSPQPASASSSAEAAGQWGEGRELRLQLTDGSLNLVHPETEVVLNSQPIHSIRVWGVGRDNGRDFAYVARDKHTRKHMCHVFRCDVPARSIASALRDICKKILIERSLAQSSSKIMASGSAAGASTPSATSSKRSVRPTSLNTKLQTKTVPTPESFPTPMEEPRKVMKAYLVGMMQVSKPCGIDVIHGAIDQLMDSVPRADWHSVSVAVAPSTVTVTFPDGSRDALDCRVRFLSFLGIGRSSQQCAFIMHTAQDTFVAHVFHCEPNAGTLCKTIEAACKLRYQKCLDARPQQQQQQQQQQQRPDGKAGSRHSIGATLKNMLGGWNSKLKSPPPS